MRLKVKLTFLQKWLVILMVINLISSVAFHFTVKKAVFDEVYHFKDIENYAEKGISEQTLMEHKMPTGSGSHMFYAMLSAITHLKMLDLRWINIGLQAILLILALFTAKNDLVFTFQLSLFLNPYYQQINSLVVTEFIPLFLILLAFLSFSYYEQNTKSKTVYLVLGSVMLSYAVVCRFYFLPLLSLPLVIGLKQWKKGNYFQPDLYSSFIVFVPIIILYTLWGGFTPPNFIPELHGGVSKVGINYLRPLSAIFILGAYSIPIVLINHTVNYRWLLLSSAITVLIKILTSKVNIWNVGSNGIHSGIIDSIFYQIKSVNPALYTVLEFVVCVASIYSIIILIEHFYKSQHQSLLQVYAIAFLIFL